ncbi:MAG TPA: MmcQ/YjbR family DNA-binding protein [Steroidobacteraceae bacterium]
MKTRRRETGPFRDPGVSADPKLSGRTAAVKVWIEAMPAAVAEPFSARNSSAPIAVLYKVMDKIFAILSFRRIENVILKCDPLLVRILRERYAGIGHRSHLDRRYWISVTLDADVPSKEIKRLVTQSYDLVCGKLSAKQKAELARLMSKNAGVRN